MGKVLELELALQEGAFAEIRDGRVIITINTEITKRDLWDTQIEMWLSEKDGEKSVGYNKNIDSGYLRVMNNKLKFSKK